MQSLLYRQESIIISANAIAPIAINIAAHKGTIFEGIQYKLGGEFQL